MEVKRQYFCEVHLDYNENLSERLEKTLTDFRDNYEGRKFAIHQVIPTEKNTYTLIINEIS